MFHVSCFMLLSIIITSYKNPELLKVCIDSVKRNIAITDCEIIVSDSETGEDTEMLMRENFPEIKFFPFDENVGLARLVEVAYETSRGDYLLFLNGDVIVKKGSIEKLLEYVRDNPSVGMAGPQLLNFNESLQFSCYRFYEPMTIVYRRTFLGKLGFAQKHLDSFLMKDFDHKSIREVDWLMGSALMIRRKAIEKVGLMDLRYKLYFEDTDWCRRFWEKGYKVVYNPESQMYHYHGRGSAGQGVLKTLLSKKLAWVHILSALKYFWKYLGKPAPKHS
ncbi:MAG: hypothetical protein QG620_390 [Patescibacteria group bacterium]|nr:hypothetical protein [Patescibacteria group bacterium]